MSKEALTARIEARNLANKYGNELFPKLAAVFTPFIGQKVVKADGCLLAKIAKLMPTFPCVPALHVYKYGSNYSLMWVVKTCVVEPTGGGHGIAHYAETSVYVGKLEGDTLVSLYNAPTFITNYTAAGVEAAREAHKVAKQAYEAARAALDPFGEHDR
jgi:hypothetical protein